LRFAHHWHTHNLQVKEILPSLHNTDKVNNYYNTFDTDSHR